MVNHGENELLSLPVKDSTDRPNAALRDVLDSFKNQDPFQWKNFVKNIRLQSRITDLNQMTSLIEEVCLPHSVIANGVIQRHLNVNQLFMQILMRFEKNRIMKKKLNAENSQTVDVVEILRIMDHIVILEYQSDKLVRFINEALLYLYQKSYSSELLQIIQDLDLHVPKSLAEFASTYTSLDSSNDFALKVLKSEEVIDTRQDHPPLKHSRIKRKSLHEKESIQIRELNHFTKSLANPSKLWRSVRQFSRKVLPDPKRKPAIINKFENPQLSILDSPLSPQKSKNDCSVIASATPECVFRRKRRHLTPVSVSTPDQTKSTGQASHFNNDELAPLIRPLF